MKIEEVYAVTPNESKDAEYPYKNTYHNDGFTIIEKKIKPILHSWKASNDLLLLLEQTKKNQLNIYWSQNNTAN